MSGCWSSDMTSELPLATPQSPAVDADGSHPKNSTRAPAKPGVTPALQWACTSHKYKPLCY